jgi:hypothetical protein
MLERAAASEPLVDSAEIFAEFGRRLRAFVSRRVRNRADAEDILQETFLRLRPGCPGRAQRNRGSLQAPRAGPRAVGRATRSPGGRPGRRNGGGVPGARGVPDSDGWPVAGA